MLSSTSNANLPQTASQMLDRPPEHAKKALRKESLRVRSSAKANIALTTKEGDRISISTRALLDIRRTEQQSITYGKDGTMTARSRVSERVRDRQSLSVSIQGDLNEEERADLKSVLGEMREVLDGLLDKDLDDVLAEMRSLGESFGELDSLDSFKLKASARQKVSYQLTERYQIRRPALSQAPSAPEAAAPEGLPEAPADGNAKPIQAAEVPAATTAPITPEEVAPIRIQAPDALQAPEAPAVEPKVAARDPLSELLAETDPEVDGSEAGARENAEVASDADRASGARIQIRAEFFEKITERLRAVVRNHGEKSQSKVQYRAQRLTHRILEHVEHKNPNSVRGARARALNEALQAQFAKDAEAQPAPTATPVEGEAEGLATYL